MRFDENIVLRRIIYQISSYRIMNVMGYLKDIYNAYIETCVNSISMATDQSGAANSGHTCNLCGITFQTKDEKEEHMKLEHSEHKQPSGVS